MRQQNSIVFQKVCNFEVLRSFDTLPKEGGAAASLFSFNSHCLQHQIRMSRIKSLVLRAFKPSLLHKQAAVLTAIVQLKRCYHRLICLLVMLLSLKWQLNHCLASLQVDLVRRMTLAVFFFLVVCLSNCYFSCGFGWVCWFVALLN